MAGGRQVSTLAYGRHCCNLDLLERRGTVQITVRALAVAMLRCWRVLPAAPAAGFAAGALNIQLLICCVCAPDACAAGEQPVVIRLAIQAWRSEGARGDKVNIKIATSLSVCSPKSLLLLCRKPGACATACLGSLPPIWPGKGSAHMIYSCSGY